jgi:serine/threonine protein kinase
MSAARKKLARLNMDPIDQVPDKKAQSFQLSASGTYMEADFAINSKGVNFAPQDVVTPNAHPSIKRMESMDQEVFQDKMEDASKMEGSEESETDSVFVSSRQQIDILHSVGRGAFGSVRAVRLKKTGKIFAMKMIPLDLSDPTVRKQAVGELRMLHELSHPNVVSYHGAFYQEGMIHIVLECMDGTLADVLKSGPPMPEAIIAEIVRETLAGLAYLHAHHTIHRDFKPSNLLLNENGQVKITDFGVSAHLGSTMAKATSWVGTTVYMSPERVQGANYSYSSDIWSLGLTALECCLGKFPYPPRVNASFFDLLDTIVNQPSPMPPVDAPYSASFREFISACLEKSPETRPTATNGLQHPFILLHQESNIKEAYLRDALQRAAAAKANSVEDQGFSEDGPVSLSGDMDFA